MNLIHIYYTEITHHWFFIDVPEVTTEIKRKLKELQDDGCRIYKWDNHSLLTIVPPDEYYIIETVLSDHYIISHLDTYISDYPNPVNDDNAKLVEL